MYLDMDDMKARATNYSGFWISA